MPVAAGPSWAGESSLPRLPGAPLAHTSQGAHWPQPRLEPQPLARDARPGVTVRLPQLVVPPVFSATGFLSQPLRSLGLVKFFGKQQCEQCENVLEGCETKGKFSNQVQGGARARIAGTWASLTWAWGSETGL